MFFYKNDRLQVGSSQGLALDLPSLAAEKAQVLYVYDLDEIAIRVTALQQAFASSKMSLHYAMKANSNPQILQLMAQLGCGADTVSGGEIKLALQAGIPSDKIIFSGVGKTKQEIRFAIEQNIKQINVESVPELRRIGEIASALGQKASVAFRLNPDVNPDTHPYITTGFRENKFGLGEETIAELVAILRQYSAHLCLKGITLHIGSQLLDLASLEEAIEKTIPIYKRIQSLGFQLERFDIGGGLGVNYDSESSAREFSLIEHYGRTAIRLLSPLGCEILLEPGRILVARAGILIGEIQYIKSNPSKTFAILNTGMHHLLRPALYQAKHRVLPLVQRQRPQIRYDVVGPICESSDFLARDLPLAELEAGDFLAIADAGAYGFSMASFYNAHQLPLEICVKQGRVQA